MIYNETDGMVSRGVDRGGSDPRSWSSSSNGSSRVAGEGSRPSRLEPRIGMFFLFTAFF